MGFKFLRAAARPSHAGAVAAQRALRALAVGTGALMAVSLAAPAASAQGVVKQSFGDWQIRCDTPPGATGEQCVLLQSVQAEDRPNVGLTVIILKTADQKSRLLRVLAPLGVLIPSGLGLKIDDQDVGRAGFVRCLPNGCVAEVVMDDARRGVAVRSRVTQATFTHLPSTPGRTATRHSRWA